MILGRIILGLLKENQYDKIEQYDYFSLFLYGFSI